MWGELTAMGEDVTRRVGDGKMARGLISLESFYRPEVPTSHLLTQILWALRQGPLRPGLYTRLPERLGSRQPDLAAMAFNTIDTKNM